MGTRRPAKTDCFAYNKEQRYCTALTQLFCCKEECKFYKKRVTEPVKKVDPKTALKIALAKECIGLDVKNPYKRRGRYFYKPFRNFIVAEPTDPVWMELVKLGYARAKGSVFSLTRAGLDWLGEELEIQIHDEEKK